MTTPAASARALAARAIAAVQAGRSLDAALDETFAALPATLHNERALIQEMTYGTVRWHFQLEALLQDFLERPIKKKDADLQALLQLGLYQLLHMRVAAHAAVKETVEATGVLGKDWAKALVNAVLRRAGREETALRARLAADPSLAHPAWLRKRLQQAYPQDWPAVAAASNERPPLALRVHRGRGSRDACLDSLQQAGIASHAQPLVESAIMVDAPVPVELLPGFRDGRISVQDPAAQLAAPLLAARPGQRVLDACAAPGGKAAQLLEQLPEIELLALDSDAARLERVRENFTRLGLRGVLAAGDATRPGDWWDGRPFERILLDAPCSATGVIRRHPDIRLHRTPADIARLSALQGRLLDALWPLLAPGGKLLYVTCSILPEENGQVLTAFLARQPGARKLALAHPALLQHARSDGVGQQILPGGDFDGFYFAGLERPAEA